MNDLPKLASPAQRALASAGITKLIEVKISQLHGIGPNTLDSVERFYQVAVEESIQWQK